MNKHLQLLDIVLDYINEHGHYNSFLDWAEMYDWDREQLDKDLENRYDES